MYGISILLTEKLRLLEQKALKVNLPTKLLLNTAMKELKKNGLDPSRVKTENRVLKATPEKPVRKGLKEIQEKQVRQARRVLRVIPALRDRRENPVKTVSPEPKETKAIKVTREIKVIRAVPELRVQAVQQLLPITSMP